MNSYKYSCPYCQQHIEYTDSYCGKQLLCPACKHVITFPAIPPGSLTLSMGIARPAQPQPGKKGIFPTQRIVAALRRFEHWNVVGQCLVPFLILAGALVVASVLRSKPLDQPAPAAPQPVDPATWERLTQAARMEQVLQERVRWVNAAFQKSKLAEQRRAALLREYGGRVDPAAARAADLQYAAAENELQAAREAFAKAMAQYRDLGGTTDFRRQLPR